MRVIVRSCLLTGALLVAALQFTATASAVEIGSRCTPSAGYPGTLIQLTGGATVTAPGVITKWGIDVPGYPGILPLKLKVFRPTASPTEWTLIGDSETGSVMGGVGVFDTRIPVAAGDVLGTFNADALGALYCNPGVNPADTLIPLGTGTTEPVVGNTYSLLAGSPAPYSLAAWANIEPDADGDGFGDETQDLCPHSAAVTAACPTVKLARFLLPLTRSSIRLLVTSAYGAPVTLAARVRIPAHGNKRARTVRFKTLKTNVSAGKLKRLNARFPRALNSALKLLPRSKKLRVTMTLTGTGLANTDVQVFRVTLRGRR